MDEVRSTTPLPGGRLISRESPTAQREVIAFDKGSNVSVTVVVEAKSVESAIGVYVLSLSASTRLVRKLKVSDWMVLGILFEHVNAAEFNRSGRLIAWPKPKTIREHSTLGISAVRLALLNLRALKLIKRLPRKASVEGSRGRNYQLTAPTANARICARYKTRATARANQRNCNDLRAQTRAPSSANALLLDRFNENPTLDIACAGVRAEQQQKRLNQSNSDQQQTGGDEAQQAAKKSEMRQLGLLSTPADTGAAWSVVVEMLTHPTIAVEKQTAYRLASYATTTPAKVKELIQLMESQPGTVRSRGGWMITALEKEHKEEPYQSPRMKPAAIKPPAPPPRGAGEHRHEDHSVVEEARIRAEALVTKELEIISQLNDQQLRQRIQTVAHEAPAHVGGFYLKITPAELREGKYPTVRHKVVVTVRREVNK